MTEPQPAAPAADTGTATVTAAEDDRPTIGGLLADRWGMTEGQLYTAVLALAVALLLTVTGLPTAHQRSGSDSLSGPGGVPLAPVPTGPASTTTAPTAAPQEAP
jgi:hypothetical protein